jgi:hypothetical protein
MNHTWAELQEIWKDIPEWIDSLRPYKEHLVDGDDPVDIAIKNYGLDIEGKKRKCYFILLQKFDFTPDCYITLAHETLHITQYVMDELAPNGRESESEAYLQSHLMRQFLKGLERKPIDIKESGVTVETAECHCPMCEQQRNVKKGPEEKRFEIEPLTKEEYEIYSDLLGDKTQVEEQKALPDEGYNPLYNIYGIQDNVIEITNLDLIKKVRTHFGAYSITGRIRIIDDFTSIERKKSKTISNIIRHPTHAVIMTVPQICEQVTRAFAGGVKKVGIILSTENPSLRFIAHNIRELIRGTFKVEITFLETSSVSIVDGKGIKVFIMAVELKHN